MQSEVGKKHKAGKFCIFVFISEFVPVLVFVSIFTFVVVFVFVFVFCCLHCVCVPKFLDCNA